MKRAAAIFITWRKSTPLSDSYKAGFLELSVDVSSAQADNVESLFESAGAYSVTIHSTNDEVCFDVAEPGSPQWSQQTLTALFDSGFQSDTIVAALRQYTGNVDVCISQLEDRDWERVWLEDFRPFSVGRDLWVCPSWYEPKPDQGTVIEIDPGMAFGTGSHETTRLCLNYLSEADLAEKSVIDFGCGSGILGIAASKLGARFVTGVDIDQRAVQTANENALKNGVDTFTALVNDTFFAQDAQRSRADVVIANILANTLVELSVEISKLVAPGGILMLSGILSTQTGFVRAAYEWGFIFEEFQEQDWVLLVGKRSG